MGEEGRFIASPLWAGPEISRGEIGGVGLEEDPLSGDLRACLPEVSTPPLIAELIIVTYARQRSLQLPIGVITYGHSSKSSVPRATCC